MSLANVSAAGGPPVNLHIDGGDASWGPTRIAWIDSFHSPATVWTANPDGSGQQQVATGTGTEELLGPAWSSDGRLAFVEGRSTVGIMIIWGLVYDDGEYSGGYVYNPRDGKTYRMKARLIERDTLRIRGYLAIPLLGQSQVWKRMRAQHE